MENNIKKIQLFLKTIEKYKNGELRPVDMNTETINLLNNRIKLKNYFNKALRVDAFLNEDNLRMIDFAIDLQACKRTLNDKIMNITKPDIADNETLTNLLELFGYTNHSLLDENTKRSFVQDIARLYKNKGNPSAIRDIINYTIFLDSEIVEFWLSRNRKDNDVFFIGQAVRDSFLGKLIGTINKDYNSLTLSDPHWQYTKSQIIELDNNLPGYGLPSMSPYFTLGINLDLAGLSKGILYLSREAKRQYNIYNTNKNLFINEQLNRISSFDGYLSILELLLTTSYLYNYRFNRNATIEPGTKIMSWNPTSPNSTSDQFIADYNKYFESNLFARTSTGQDAQNIADAPVSTTWNKDGNIEHIFDESTGKIETIRYLAQREIPKFTYERQGDDYNINNLILNNIISDKKDYAYYYHEKRLFISGGIDINGNVDNNVYEYSLDTHEKRLFVSLPVGLYRHNIIFDQVGRKLFIFNGLYKDQITGEPKLNESIYIYIIEDDLLVDRENPFARIDATVQPITTNFIVSPGYNPDTNKYENNIYIIQNLDGVFEESIPVPFNIDNIGIQPSMMYNPYENKIYVSGGYKAGNLSSLSYTIDNSLLEEYIINGGIDTNSIFIELPQMPVNRSRFITAKLNISTDMIHVGGWLQTVNTNDIRNNLISDYINTSNTGHSSLVEYLKYEYLFGTNIFIPSSRVDGYDNIHNIWNIRNITYYNTGGLKSENPYRYIIDTSSIYIVEDDVIYFYNPITYKIENDVITDIQIRRDIDLCMKWGIKLKYNEFHTYENQDPEKIDVVSQVIDPNNRNRRKDRDERLRDRETIFSQTEYYISETNEQNMDILTTVNPEFANYINSIKDLIDEEFNLIFYELLNTLDIICISAGFKTTFRGLFLLKDDKIIPKVVEEFKPINSRYAGLSLIYSINDRIGDTFGISEFIKTIPKIFHEEDLKIHDVSDSITLSPTLYLVEDFSYRHGLDQQWIRHEPDMPYQRKLTILDPTNPEAPGNSMYIYPITQIFDGDQICTTDNIKCNITFYNNQNEVLFQVEDYNWLDRKLWEHFYELTGGFSSLTPFAIMDEASSIGDEEIFVICGEEGDDIIVGERITFE